MGKTRIVQRFVREHGSHFDPQRGTTRLPVVALQMPPTPHERDFYEEVLVAMKAVLPVKLSVSNLRQRVRVLARQLGVRMLIIDEIHSMLSGTFREQRIFLNALRFLANDRRRRPSKPSNLGMVVARRIEAANVSDRRVGARLL